MGCDIGGEFLRKDFEKHGICSENCKFYNNEVKTTFASIWINAENGSRTIITSEVNTPEYSCEDFKMLDLDDYCWIHFECRPNIDDIMKMIDHANKWNERRVENLIKISLEVEKPRTDCLDILNLVDVVIVSKDLASACGYSDMESTVKGMTKYLKPGSCLICPWGEKGACAKTADSPEVHLSPSFPPPRMVSTLGAGDTFVAAVILAFLKGQPLREAVGTACRVAGARCGALDPKGLSDLFPHLRYS